MISHRHRIPSVICPEDSNGRNISAFLLSVDMSEEIETTPRHGAIKLLSRPIEPWFEFIQVTLSLMMASS